LIAHHTKLSRTLKVDGDLAVHVPAGLKLDRGAPTLPRPAVAGGYTAGAHNFAYWSTIIPDAFDFVAATLSPRPA
jgi:hypothetical protein